MNSVRQCQGCEIASSRHIRALSGAIASSSGETHALVHWNRVVGFWRFWGLGFGLRFRTARVGGRKVLGFSTPFARQRGDLLLLPLWGDPGSFRPRLPLRRWSSETPWFIVCVCLHGGCDQGVELQLTSQGNIRMCSMSRMCHLICLLWQLMCNFLNREP